MRSSRRVCVNGKILQFPKSCVAAPYPPWTLATCATSDQRDQLASFWLAAPEDLLPGLWSSPAGEVTKSMIRALNQKQYFRPEQVAFRNAIGRAAFNLVSIRQRQSSSFWLIFSTPSGVDENC